MVLPLDFWQIDGERTLRGLLKRIIDHAETFPEATPLCPAGLLHLGNRAAVDQALSGLARSSDPIRVCPGVSICA